MRKKLQEARVDDFDRFVGQSKSLIKKVQRMRDQGISYQRIADLFNLWRIDTRSGEGKWYSKTIKDIVQ